MPRKIVVGDIHGALKALDQLLAKIGLRDDDRILFLGDYVDGWSQSAEVIERLIRLDETHDYVFIRGNHDAWCEQWLQGEVTDEDWLFYGGKLTRESYSGYSSAQRARHLEFFNRMKNYYVDEDNRLFIHAGFSSIHGPEKEYYESNFYWDRTLWEMALVTDDRIDRGSKKYPKRLLLYPEIFIGHTPTTNYEVSVPMRGCNVWNIDTGAAFWGRLSAMDVETKVYWQSDSVQDLYPDERGRN